MPNCENAGTPQATKSTKSSGPAIRAYQLNQIVPAFLLKQRHHAKVHHRRPTSGTFPTNWNVHTYIPSISSFVSHATPNMRHLHIAIHDAHAASWDDGSPSSSKPLQTQGTAQALSTVNAHVHVAARRRRFFPRTSMLSAMLLLTLCLLSATMVRGISDPGLPDPDRGASQDPLKPKIDTSQNHVSAKSQHADAHADILHSLRAATRTPPPLDDKSLMPLLYHHNPVSIPKGCHRTSSLIGQSSINPWSSHTLLMAAGHATNGDTTASLRPPQVYSELILCPVSVEGGQYKLLSVSGFIALSIPMDPATGSPSAAVDGALAQAEAKQAAATATSSSPPWPQQGQETEGFWRQRNGQPEWEPQSTDPLPLITPSDVSPNNRSSGTQAINASQAKGRSLAPSTDSSSPPPPPPDHQPQHVEAYDAWSASIGGESAKDWLSFNEWKERHLNELREKQEAERRAAIAEKKKNSARNKQQHRQGAQPNSTAPTSQQPNISNASDPQAVIHNTTRDTKTNVTNTKLEMPLNSTGSAPQPADALAASNASTSKSATASLSAQHGNATSQVHSELPVSAPTTKTASTDNSSDTAPRTSAQNLSEAQPQAVASDLPPSPPSPSGTGDAATLSQSIPAIRDPASLLKTLRHRWNFASMDCAAVVHRTNPSAKFSSSILSEKKDRYLLSPCPDVSGDPAGNYVIVELCDEISIDTIVLANYEFFSRMFKRFRVSVAQSLSGTGSDQQDGWYELGSFRARNFRGLQVFNASLPTHSKAPTRFFRYVRIDFLEYYGNEYYCPLSLLRVYGLTQMDDYRREEEEERKAAALAAAAAANGYLAIGDGEDEMDDVEADTVMHENQTLDATGTVAAVDDMWDKVWKEKAQMSESHGVPFTGQGHWDNAPPITVQPDSFTVSTPAADPNPRTLASPTDQPSVTPTIASTSQHGNEVAGSTSASINTPIEAIPTQKAEKDTFDDASLSLVQPTSGPRASEVAVCEAIDSQDERQNRLHVGSAGPLTTCATNSQGNAKGQESQRLRSTLSGSDRAESPLHSSIAQSALSESMRSSSVNPGPSASGNSGQSYGANYNPPPNGNSNTNTGSESIYRTITKRLNALEANATLSLQYIEHSGQMLREVFRAMERRQEVRLGEMLRALNASNWRQIEALKRRQQVDLQRAIFEFDVHRQQTEAERRALLQEVHLLATEVMFERRLGIVQMLLVLGLFGFMALTRGPSTTNASPFLQSTLAKLAAASGSGSPKARGAKSLSDNKRHDSIDGMHENEEGLRAAKDNAGASSSAVEVYAARSGGAARPRVVTGTSAERPVHLRTLRARTSFRRRGSSSSFNRSSPRQGTSDLPEASQHPSSDPSSGEVHMDGDLVSSSNSAPRLPLPTYDIAEMSDSELRDYLGFSSPSDDRARSPALDSEADDDEFGGDGHFHTTDDQMMSRQLGQQEEEAETGDEGAETAIEDLDGAQEEAEDEDERQYLRVFPRSNTIEVLPPRRAASAEPSFSMQDDRDLTSDMNRPVAMLNHSTPLKAALGPANGLSTPLAINESHSGPSTPSRRSPVLVNGGHESDADDDEEGNVSRGHYPLNPWQKVPSRRRTNSNRRQNGSGAGQPLQATSPPTKPRTPRPSSPTPFLMYDSYQSATPERYLMKRSSSGSGSGNGKSPSQQQQPSSYTLSPSPRPRHRHLTGPAGSSSNHGSFSRPGSPLGPARSSQTNLGRPVGSGDGAKAAVPSGLKSSSGNAGGSSEDVL